MEVDYAIRRQLKTDKCSGPDGLSASLIKVLPLRWITTITCLFNALFFSSFPVAWIYAKMIMLFKKGCPSNCDNYRGISIINSLRKVYDYVLSNRLQKWFTPEREQAGAQPGRGCIEHIVTLRLLMDLCARKKLPLYIVYVDFSKAYDRVSRRTLFQLLQSYGCGKYMLHAIKSLYRISKSIIGGAIISANRGVPQGSPSSCLLFTLYVNKLITMIKQRCQPDGYLGWLHTLMLMDDTVILATNKQHCLEKLTILMDYTVEYGMKINESKTKFMALNVPKGQAATLIASSTDGSASCIISSTDSYVYLGSIFTADGSVLSSIKAHVESKRKDLLKFVTFSCKNADAPFTVKHKVFHACFVAAITYGCESWVNCNLKSVEKLYFGAVKALLNVRSTTCNDLCLQELGLPKLMYYVRQCQSRFFDKIAKSPRSSADDPFTFVMQLCRSHNTSTVREIDSLSNHDFIAESRRKLRESITNSSKSKVKTYLKMNPDLAATRLYEMDVPEHIRASATKFRLSAHNLRVETGRWARLLREERLCPCGEVQDEVHVVESCHLLSATREKYPNLDLVPTTLEWRLEGGPDYPEKSDCVRAEKSRMKSTWWNPVTF